MGRRFQGEMVQRLRGKPENVSTEFRMIYAWQSGQPLRFGLLTKDISLASQPSRSRRASPKDAVIPSLVHEAQVTTLINLAARLTGRAARIRMGAIGAWPGQIPLLLWLLEKDGVIQKELVERANMEQSTVAEHLERLERAGFVYRKQGADDRRKYRFYLTDKARAAARELIEMLESGARTFTAGIPKDDLAVFDRVIRQIIERLEDYVQKAAGAAKPAARKAASRRDGKSTRSKRVTSAEGVRE
jgi:DNA-binding MarR family transcriptional regulator